MNSVDADIEYDFERPPFLAQEEMDRANYLQPSPSFGGISAGVYKRATICPGPSSRSSNPLKPVELAV